MKKFCLFLFTVVSLSVFTACDNPEIDIHEVLFKEPCLEWGTSLSRVQSYMSEYEKGNSSAIKRGDYYLYWYYPKYLESEIQYYFASETSNLQRCNVFFDPKDVGMRDILEFFNKLSDKYLYLGDEDDVYYYKSKDETTFVGITTNTEGKYLVIYLDNRE
ncbi:MAG: hypothetical protein IJJ83_10895 [Muribaculaceae bacterium]|nr:hypothetical protein [Muribaculaceae bacterium]